jgi:hypothetical protein
MRRITVLGGCVLICACWRPTLPPERGRYRATSTTLRESDFEGHQHAVVVAGGCTTTPVTPGCELASTELYERTTGAWSPGPDLIRGRFGHVAVRLRETSVLVTGGLATEAGALTTDAAVDAERLLLRQISGWPATFIPAGRLADGRINHTATVLRDGSVLVVGGARYVGGELSIVAGSERWDPDSEDFLPDDPPLTARGYHTATLLPDGTVLVAGGLGADLDALDSVEIYDPGAPPGQRWRAGPSLPVRLSHHAAALVGGGTSFRLVIAGGGTSPLTAWTVLPDALAAEVTPDATDHAVLGPWLEIGAMSTPRYSHALAQLKTGHLFAVGGLDDTNQQLGSVDVLAPGAIAWTAGAPLGTPRGANVVVSGLTDGRLLVTGGWGPQPTAEVLDLCAPQLCTSLVPSCLCPDACPDGDGDGLSDAWETQGLDLDGDGDIDERLAGADPGRRDLFLEADYMVAEGAACPDGPEGLPGIFAPEGCFKPFQSSLDALTRVLGARGIHVHIDVSDAVPYHPVSSHGLGAFALVPDVKRRFSPAWRRGVYHYVLFADRVVDPQIDPETGVQFPLFAGAYGEVFGDDVLMGGIQLLPDGELVQLRAGRQGVRLVHEVGHNLGFGHAGPPPAPVDPPNYFSIMGGAFLPDPDFDADDDEDIDEDGTVDAADVALTLGRIDFSSGGLGALDEAALREKKGVPGARLPYAVTYWCPPDVTRAPAAACAGAATPTRRACTRLVGRDQVRVNGVEHVVQRWQVVARSANEVDWNCDGTIQATAVAVNLNNTWRYTGAGEASAAILDVFPGFDDWELMDLAFQCHSSGDVAGLDLPVFAAR